MKRLLCDFLVLTLLIILVLSAAALNRVVARKRSMVSIKVGDTILSVETVKTQSQIEKGLGDRSKVMGDGMLFYMPEPQKPTFWMKNMLFALDFIWINKDKVVDLTENVQPPVKGEQDNQLRQYVPATEVTHVLEVPAGFVKEHRIKKGDAVQGL